MGIYRRPGCFSLSEMEGLAMLMPSWRGQFVSCALLLARPAYRVVLDVRGGRGSIEKVQCDKHWCGNFK